MKRDKRNKTKGKKKEPKGGKCHTNGLFNLANVTGIVKKNKNGNKSVPYIMPQKV